MPRPRPLLSETEARVAIGGLNVVLNATDLEWLKLAIQALTPVIEHYAGPVVLRSQEVTLSGGRDSVTLPFRPHSILSVTAGGLTIDPSAYWAEEGTGIIRYGAQGGTSWQTWPGGGGGITVQALVGLEETPPNIKLAAMELIRFWWQQGRQGGTQFGSNQTDFQIPQGFSIPNRVKSLIYSGAVNKTPGFA